MTLSESSVAKNTCGHDSKFFDRLLIENNKELL